MTDSPRQSIAALLLAAILVSTLSWVSAVAFWVDRSVGREAAFRAHAYETLTQESSKEALAVRLMDEAIEELPLLAFVRGAGEQAVIVLIDSGAFDPVFDRLVAAGHGHVLSASDEPFTANLTDVRAVLVAPIAELAPELADRIPVDVFEAVVILDSDALPIVGRVARGLPAVAVFAAAGAVFAAVATVMLARRRSWALLAVGAGVFVAGLGVAAWSAFGASLASSRITDELTRVLVVNGYGVISPALRTEGVFLMAVGAAGATIGLVASFAAGVKEQEPGVKT